MQALTTKMNLARMSPATFNRKQGCQIGFFDAKFGKLGFFQRQLASKKTVWLFGFFFSIFGFFLEAVGTYYQTGVLAF